MPLIETTGAASSKGFGQFAKTGVATYIEDVFSTWLYTGNGSTQTITNGIDLSTYGGLTWFKKRNGATASALFDSARGAQNYLSSSSTGAQTSAGVNAWVQNTNGFSLGSGGGAWNGDQDTYVSWTFRKQPKFFDVVTYTGNGDYSQQVNHLLGSIPGAILMKCTSLGGTNWVFACRRNDTTYDVMYLNTTGSSVSGVFRGGVYGNATQFGPGWFANVVAMNDVNANGATYVAYLFAHNAGGFGLTGTDNVISCGSFTTDGTGNASVTLGYEPQWLLIKSAASTESWYVLDNMRGLVASPGTTSAYLIPNSSQAESTWGSVMQPTATGFTTTGLAANTLYIYIAIRRGPMKTPTSGTSVFLPASYTGVTGGATVTTNFPVDMIINQRRNGATAHDVVDRLRGGDYYLSTYTTDAEATSAGLMNFQSNTSVKENDYGGNPANTSCSWIFRRAPGFFDEVCYTGNGINGTTQSHNLGVVPEMWIVKRRSTADSWVVGTSARGSNVVELNLADGEYNAGTAYFSNGSVYTAPTSSVIWFGSNARVNQNGGTFVAYLFASCPGVSKVGSYTGTGALQTINCGFTSGARFVLIKRTDSTGDWYVYDSARGITSGNDPYLFLNSTAAEVTSTNYVDTDTTGFKVTAAAPAGLNASGGTYIFLAIA